MGKRMRITIDGKPQPKERPRVYKGHGITPTRTKNYEARVAREWAAKYPEQLSGPCTVECFFYLPIPTSWSKAKKEQARRSLIFPEVRPDLDNLLKIILDGLNGVAYLDDKQVVKVSALKAYSDEPRTEVMIEEL